MAINKNIEMKGIFFRKNENGQTQKERKPLPILSTIELFLILKKHAYNHISIHSSFLGRVISQNSQFPNKSLTDFHPILLKSIEILKVFF